MGAEGCCRRAQSERKLVRYIHRNPLKAGLVETLDDYPWSRHS